MCKARQTPGRAYPSHCPNLFSWISLLLVISSPLQEQAAAAALARSAGTTAPKPAKKDYANMTKEQLLEVIADMEKGEDGFVLQ